MNSIGNRRAFLKNTLLALATAALPSQFLLAAEADFLFEPERDLIPAPQDPALWPTYRAQLVQNRQQNREKLNYKDDYYRNPAYFWSARNYNCCFVMLCDETFYNPKSGRYTLDAYLDNGEREFGGYDSIVLWHAYPRIGVDDRNQFDLYRDMPGGVPGLRDLVAAAQKRGVCVFLDYNPWDMGTRREAGSGAPDGSDIATLAGTQKNYSQGDVRALVAMVKALNADGIFLDTMPWAPPELRPSLDAVRPGLVFEGEVALPLEHVFDHHGSWAQGRTFLASKVPGVLRNKWFERRHMMHLVDRWNFDHSAELHSAWMNGTGMMVWENVFGTWMGWSPRDQSLLKSMVRIQRLFTKLFSGERWTPLVPTLQPGVYASLWEANGRRLWTLVNQNQEAVKGALLEIEPVTGQHYFDLVAGQHIRSVTSRKATLAGEIPPRGIGCFLATSTAGNRFTEFLKRQAEAHAGASLDIASPLTETILATPPKIAAKSSLPKGMVEIPAATLDVTFEIQGRECGFYEGSRAKDKTFNLNRDQTVKFERRVEFPRFAVDVTPVTNDEYLAFVSSSKYAPKHPENFLKHWVDGRPPAGKERHPVVYVDLDDARAYARWAGKRLPTEEEWQYAAQGTDGRKWPWGADFEAGRCNDVQSGGTTAVDAFSNGRSPIGCLDLCGNVWQWTESERSDGRTRFAMIRGGGWFNAKGSQWYVSGGPKPVNYSAKMLLMWPGLERCATVGFRCVADLQ